MTTATAAASFDPPAGYVFPACGERLLHRFPLPAGRWFEYHCWESLESADAELWKHTHQRCVVERRLTPEESDMEMYAVRFPDGSEFVVFADELVYRKSQFYCEDCPYA